MRTLIATTLFLFPILSLVATHLQAQETDAQKFPDVVDVSVTDAGDGRYHFDVTLSSPYDTPERYADAFRVLTLAGDLLGVRKLFHDHANEQPFTRRLRDIEVPEGVPRVVIEGRDKQNGYGGDVVEASLPGR